MEVSTAATKEELKEVVVDIEKEHDVSNAEEEASLKNSLIFLIPLKKSNPDSLISYVDLSLMRASDGTKKLDGLIAWKRI